MQITGKTYIFLCELNYLRIFVSVQSFKKLPTDTDGQMNFLSQSVECYLLRCMFGFKRGKCCMKEKSFIEKIMQNI